jgi:hypothetical protein
MFLILNNKFKIKISKEIIITMVEEDRQQKINIQINKFMLFEERNKKKKNLKIKIFSFLYY